MNEEFSGKTIVVTGSSRGIGSHIVRRLSDQGASVVINYNKSRTNAEKLALELQEKNRDIFLLKADMSNENEVKEFYRSCKNKYGKIDVLINNAGICKRSSIFTIKQDDWDDVLSTNLKSVFMCTKYFSKAMASQGYGKIINISSIFSMKGAIEMSSYASSKAGVSSFTKSAAKELAQFNILVNAVCPGHIELEKNQKETIANKANDLKDYLKNCNYLDALLNFVVYMCSDNFHSITGQIFNLDSRV